MKHLALLMLIFLTVLSSCKKEDLVDTDANQITDVNSKAQFDSEVANGVSLIFFHASWCSVCKAQRPAVEATSEKADYSDVFFGEVEFEQNNEINQDRNVFGFPTIVIYKDNVEVERLTSSGHSEEDLANLLDAHL